MTPRQWPAVRIAVSFMIGIATARWTSCDLTESLIISAITIGLGWGCHCLCRPDRFMLKSALVTLSIVASGHLSYVSADYLLQRRSLPQDLLLTSQPALLQITEFPKRGISYRTEADLLAVEPHGMLKNKIRMAVSIDSSYQIDSLYPGQQILADVWIKSPEIVTNVHMFNYGQYLRDRGITYQAIVRRHAIYRFMGIRANGILHMTSLRKSMMTTLKTCLSEDAAGLLAAMMLGSRHELNKAVIEAFEDAGAVHVLAVSGLHVGMICMVILVCIKQVLWKSGGQQIIKMAIFLIALYAYCQLTGAAPPVLRAALMFSMVLLAMEFGVNQYALNTLGLSALIILCYSPHALFQVSFQLSYLAVLSILIFYKRILRLISFNHWMPRTVWQMVALSLSAQVLTWPLTIYYFHQWPVYFAFSSLVAILGVQLLLALGFFLLIIHPVSAAVSSAISAAIEAVSTGMVRGVTFFTQLPWHKTEQVFMTPLLVFLCYACILFFIRFYRCPDQGRTRWFCYILMITSIYITTLKARHHFQDSVVVYGRTYKCIDLFKGHAALSWCDDRMNESTSQFLTRDTRRAHRIKHIYQLDTAPIFSESKDVK